jgi:DNA-binding response OmpR family regulator
MTGKQILLVEDNEKIMTGNIRMFKRKGYETAVALTLAEARASIDEHRPDAIILDIMLPDGSGLDFMQELRVGKDADIPILLLTGLGAKEDIIRGLMAGGDDYLTKPYYFNELLARVEALLRRTSRVPEIISKGALSLDPLANQAFLNGKDLTLSQKEFSLLILFAQNEGETISADYIYEKVWKAPLGSDKNSLQVLVSRLRKKIAPAGYDIVTIRGQGYVFKKI